jgi:NAD(P)-dependent dehydrogenase (short-subunit alcohol dehydrogenase family)
MDRAIIVTGASKGIGRAGTFQYQNLCGASFHALSDREPPARP